MMGVLSSSESPPASSTTSSKPNGRKGSKKVRTGCITCKIRKVKCDEAKPHCLRCIKTGRKCDGYKQSSGPSPASGSGSLSPIPGFESPEECRAFEYYRNRSASILSGTVDVGFWGGLVLQLSTTESAVRHALLAVSSLHECIETKTKLGRDLDKRFAFQEYGKAIRSLRTWSQGNEPSPIPLLVCVLFICIEFLADRESAAQLHICQGRKILFGMADGSSPAMDTIKRSLVPIYARLSLASFLYGSRPDPIPEHLRLWTTVPAIFTSLDEARCVLYHILDEGLQFTSRATTLVYSPETDVHDMEKLQFEQHRMLSQLGRWNSAFTVLASMSPRSPSITNAQNLLRIYYEASLIWVSTALQMLEIAYDSHLAGFATIISLASSIINSPAFHSSRAAAFSFETEIVAPVFWTATKCRHPTLRRAAVRLLGRDRVRSRRENLWHTEATIAVASRVIEMEEAGIEAPFDWTLDPADPFAGLNDFMKLDGLRPGLVRKQTLDPDELKISLSEPPNITPPPMSFTDPLLDLSSDTASSEEASSREVSEASSSMASFVTDATPPLDVGGLDEAHMESPFGIDEFRRVKNAAFGPKDENGVWVTFFRDPELGMADWRVTREFLRC